MRNFQKRVGSFYNLLVYLMEPITSPELEKCLKEKEVLEQKSKDTEDEISTDQNDAYIVQSDAGNQQSELKNILEEFTKTQKEWTEFKTQFDVLTGEYNGLVAQAGPLSFRYKACQAAVASAQQK